jgi:hypothetical protein
MKILMSVSGAMAYFGVTAMIVGLLLKVGIGDLFRDIVVICVGGVILACFSYTGTWITVAGRNAKAFWKKFVLVDLVAGALGALAAWVSVVLLRLV